MLERDAPRGAAGEVGGARQHLLDHAFLAAEQGEPHPIAGGYRRDLPALVLLQFPSQQAPDGATLDQHLEMSAAILDHGAFDNGMLHFRIPLMSWVVRRRARARMGWADMTCTDITQSPLRAGLARVCGIKRETPQASWPVAQCQRMRARREPLRARRRGRRMTDDSVVSDVYVLHRHLLLSPGWSPDVAV